MRGSNYNMKKENKKGIKGFFKELEGHMKNTNELSINTIYSLFPTTNPNTISWRLYELVQQGKIYRTGHGYYALEKINDHNAIGYDYMQKKSQMVFDIVAEYGFKYYITGLDSLVGEIHHLPEKYPVLLVVEKDGIKEIKDSIGDKGLIVLTENEIKIINRASIKEAVDVIIFKGKDFSLSVDYIAKKEKGFIDLYYAVTRMEYSISVPELSRIYSNLQRNKTIAVRIIKDAAKDRRITVEVNWLIELDKASKTALEFMQYQIERVK